MSQERYIYSADEPGGLSILPQNEQKEYEETVSGAWYCYYTNCNTGRANHTHLPNEGYHFFPKN